MQEQNPRIEVEKFGDVSVVQLTDRKILDEVGITQIGDQLNELVAQAEVPLFVLDFVNVSNMSSSALGMLITLNKRIRRKNGDLRLCNIHPAIQEVFEITRLNEIFRICSSRREAVESLE